MESGQPGDRYLEGYGPDRGRSSESSGNIPSNPASILCSDAIISAATVSYPMYGDEREAENRRPSSGEIESLADDGVVEVMLLGQNVNSYGKTLDRADYLCTASYAKSRRLMELKESVL